MPYSYRAGSAILMLTALVALTACGPGSKPVVEDYEIIADVSGLELDESQLPALIYVRPGAPSFASYNRFIIDAVQVNYSDPNIIELKPEDVGRMQQAFRTKMVDELLEAGYEVGTRTEPNTMRISFTIANLKAPSAAANVTTVLAPLALSVGEVTIEGVFIDAPTNRIEAVAVDRSAGSRLLNKSPWSTWADVEATFGIWAKGIRESIDEAHGK